MKICLVAIGEQGMCEEIFDICKHAATDAGPERLHIVKAYLTLSTIQLNEWAANNLTTVDIFFLSIIVRCYKLNKSKNHTATLFIT